jgi:hypothetical protein
MTRLSGALAGIAVLFFTLSAGAQSRGREPYGQPRNYPNSRNRYSLIDRVMSDLNRAASSGYLDGHERKHFDRAADSLRDFQSRWSRGKFDKGKLDKAIENLDHLARADRVRGRDRDALTRDLYDLRQFRATRGGYNQSPGYYPAWR